MGEIDSPKHLCAYKENSSPAHSKCQIYFNMTYVCSWLWGPRTRWLQLMILNTFHKHTVRERSITSWWSESSPLCTHQTFLFLEVEKSLDVGVVYWLPISVSDK